MPVSASDVIVKIVTIFLIVIAVLAMFGRLRLRLPGLDRRAQAKCPRCGRHKIGKGPCPCEGGRT